MGGRGDEPVRGTSALTVEGDTPKKLKGFMGDA